MRFWWDKYKYPKTDEEKKRDRVLACGIYLITLIICIIYPFGNDLATSAIESVTEAEEILAENERISKENTKNSGNTEYTERNLYDSTETDRTETLDNLFYTIDITNAANGKILGNTSSDDGYCGRIEIQLSDNDNTKVVQGKTYVVEASPMIGTSDNGIPILAVININKASDKDIKKLDKIRKTVSTFNRKMIDYNNMELDDIIEDANNSYATWTQDQITEFNKFIKSLGYSEKNNKKSYVCTRDKIKETYNKK